MKKKGRGIFIAAKRIIIRENILLENFKVV